MIQTIILSGILLGSLYALMAAGLALVFGTMRMYNFTHGSFIMIGAYVAWTLTQQFGSEFLIMSIILTVVIVFLVGLLLERELINPFIKRPDADLVAVITTLAGMVFLKNLALLIWGPRFKQLPSLLDGHINLLGSRVASQEILILIVAPIILILLGIFLKKTRTGFAIRAVEQNLDSSLLVGVNVSNIYMINFGIAASLASIAGIFLGAIRFITPSLGDDPLLKAFIITVVGGLGNLNGALKAAFLIGFIEAISVMFIGIYWTPALLFLIMIIILLFKPTGLFGEG